MGDCNSWIICVMKVLHICNDYCGSKVHRNLYVQLDKMGIEQVVYTYFRGTVQVEKNKFESVNTAFYYRPILRPFHRLFYHLKVNRVSKDLIKLIKDDSFDLMHATTLFSDGALAYHLWKKRHIPYIVTVRNTDINEFLVYAPHTWSMGINVLKHAKKIIFISKAPMDKFCGHFIINHFLPEIRDRIIVQPNGIDEYWLDNVKPTCDNNEHNLIYVGKFDYNKNVVRLIHAVLDLKGQYPDIKLHLIGGDGCQEKRIMKLIKEHSDCLTYHGKVYDRVELQKLYLQSSIFAMPSIHETFGLVYIEALTQNLAVIYTKNQGIDGLLDERVGEKVNAFSTQSIRDAIAKIFDNRETYKAGEIVEFDRFRWGVIANNYHIIYQTVLK